MKLLRPISIAFMASIVAFFGGAVVLGILNIYLAGHGIDWQSQDFENGMTGMSPLSVILAVGVLFVFLGVFGVVVWVGRKKSS